MKNLQWFQTFSYAYINSYVFVCWGPPRPPPSSMVFQEDSWDLAFNHVHKIYLQWKDLQQDQQRERVYRTNSEKPGTSFPGSLPVHSPKTCLILPAMNYDGTYEMLSAGEAL